MSSASASASPAHSSSDQELILIKDHAKRHQTDKPPAIIVKALKLNAEDVNALYVSDSQTYSIGRNVSDPSNHISMVQIHYTQENPSANLQKFRGMVFRVDPRRPELVKVVIKSSPYEEPIVASEFPEAYKTGADTKFSKSRQGFVVRLAKPGNTVLCSTHRKLDSSRSKFGNSIPMKEMFMEASAKRGLDVESLFRTSNDSTYCHVFFVSHVQMRLLPTEDDNDELIYLGSMKQMSTDWGDIDDNDDELIYEDMVPCDPGLKVLEDLRPTFYNHSEAEEMFGQGIPLVAWVKGKSPTRLVPTSYDRKEQIRGNVPNLKLAWYMLLSKYKEDELKEVIPESKHSLLSEYWAELEQMLDGTAMRDQNGVVVCIQGGNVAKEGSLVKHLIGYYYKAQKEMDLASYYQSLGKATGPLVRTLMSYSKNMLGMSQVQKTQKLTRFLRKLLWRGEGGIPSERLYTAITEFKRAMAPAVERAVMDGR